MARFWALFIAVTLGACGSESTDTSASVNTDAELEGTWVSECFSIGAFAYSAKAKVVNQGLTSKKELSIYSDASCIVPLYAENYGDTFVIGDAIEGLTDTKAIDFTRVSHTRTIKDADFVKNQNAAEAFGYSDWKIGSPKDLAGKVYSEGDQANRSVGEIQYNIFKIIDDKELMFGDTTTMDGSSEDTRPDTLDNDITYEKQ